jgi:hypothetical protein
MLTQTERVPSVLDIEKALTRVEGYDENVYGGAIAPKRTKDRTILID